MRHSEICLTALVFFPNEPKGDRHFFLRDLENNPKITGKNTGLFLLALFDFWTN
jgi:hypothetical protein